MGGWVGEGSRRTRDDGSQLYGKRLTYVGRKMNKDEIKTYNDAANKVYRDAFLWHGLPCTLFAVTGTHVIRSHFHLRPKGFWRFPLYGAVGVGTLIVSSLYGLIEQYDKRMVPLNRKYWTKYGRNYNQDMGVDVKPAKRPNPKTTRKADTH